MKRFENGLVNFISKLPVLTIGLVGLFAGLAMGIYGINAGLEASKGTETNPLKSVILLAIVSVAYMIYMIFFYKKLQAWMERALAKPLILLLISSNETRRTALIFGAILFTCGFFLQLGVLLFS